jgi:hypothetical protein
MNSEETAIWLRAQREMAYWSDMDPDEKRAAYAHINMELERDAANRAEANEPLTEYVRAQTEEIE